MYVHAICVVCGVCGVLVPVRQEVALTLPSYVNIPGILIPCPTLIVFVFRFVRRLATVPRQCLHVSVSLYERSRSEKA